MGVIWYAYMTHANMPPHTALSHLNYTIQWNKVKTAVFFFTCSADFIVIWKQKATLTYFKPASSEEMD